MFVPPVVVKDIAIGAFGISFDSQAGVIGHSVADGSAPLRRFFGAVLSKRGGYRRYNEDFFLLQVYA